MQDALAIDLLSTETQFELLGNLDCELLGEQPVRSEELSQLAERLSYTENSLGDKNEQVIQLKKQYSLLQIKDYLLLQEMSRKCGTDPVFVLYFYSNKGDCTACPRAGEVLTYLRQEYPGLRVYSFDYHLELGALQTLTAIRKVDSGQLPAFIINNRAPIYGFRNVEEMESLIPELETLRATTTEEIVEEDLQ
jgi:thiol-disulfide isomerase/thioredoxin